MYPTTFVTAFLNIYNHSAPISDELRVQFFAKIANTDIPIVIFCSECHLPLLKQFEEKPNIRIQTTELNRTEIFRELQENNIHALPDTRNPKKDTFEYLCLMNSKTEFVEKAIEMNPWNSTHYAWIDFNFFHIFSNNPRFTPEKSNMEQKMSTEWLSSLKTRQLNDHFLTIPGCWNYNYDNPHAIVNEICWRFCGGYFIGSKMALSNFCKMCKTQWQPFLQEYKTLTWEVNYWSWLELRGFFKPSWYHADHDYAMLTPSNDFNVLPLFPHFQFSKKIRSEYPEIPNFSPTSISVVKWEGIYVLNTRFVNYEIMNDGRYYIKHPQMHLHTRNVFSHFDSEAKEIKEIKEMFESVGELEDHNDKIYGLEDIRLYVNRSHQISFIASNNNHIKHNKTRIVRGIYDIQNSICRNLCIIQPPTETYCEKNWIPLPSYNKGQDDDKYDYFIYKWQPFEIGKVLRSNSTVEVPLEIVVSIPNWTPRFDRVRGSSDFIEISTGWLGIVHLSEEHTPRHYYHLLVLLDKTTFLPIQYSRMFVFNKKSIEFCIGFDVVENSMYKFWISNFDREPEYIELPYSTIELEYSFALGCSPIHQ